MHTIRHGSAVFHKRKMKRHTIIVAIIIVLSIIIMISLNLRSSKVEKQKEILSNAQIILKSGNTQIVLNKDDITLNSEEFEAVLDTSKTEPTKHIYKGVQLKELLKKNNIDFVGKIIILSAADGYSAAYSSLEVSIDKNIYIAFMEDGKYLGSINTGGRGPYESIVVSDTFSNRRCKWITEIEVK